VTGDTLASVRAYGAVASFTQRSAMVANAAEAYFHRRVGDPIQGKLDTLMSIAGHLSGRRNEIAHGVVTPYFGRGMPPRGFALHASGYLARKTDLIGAPKYNLLTPKYIYTSKEILAFSAAFAELRPQAHEIWGSIYNARHAALIEKFRKPTGA
jgi:hypothetical protein